MKIFCSYPFTGEDLAETTARMRAVVDVLENRGIEVYCDRFDKSLEQAQIENDIPKIFKTAFRELASSDAIVAVVPSARRSVGQLMEIGAAYDRGIPIYLFEHISAKGATYLSQLVSRTVSWESADDLVSQLNGMKFIAAKSVV